MPCQPGNAWYTTFLLLPFSLFLFKIAIEFIVIKYNNISRIQLDL